MKRCKRCGHTESYLGAELDSYGICPGCAQDLFNELEAERMEDLMPLADLTQAQYDAMEEAAYAREEKA